jgi:hypothetical protein
MDVDNATIHRMVGEVLRYLDFKEPDARHDVYAWSDGRVTPYEPEHAEDDAFLVSTFSPGDRLPPPAVVRESIARGFATVRDQP